MDQCRGYLLEIDRGWFLDRWKLRSYLFCLRLKKPDCVINLSINYQWEKQTVSLWLAKNKELQCAPFLCRSSLDCNCHQILRCTSIYEDARHNKVNYRYHKRILSVEDKMIFVFMQSKSKALCCNIDYHLPNSKVNNQGKCLINLRELIRDVHLIQWCGAIV